MDQDTCYICIGDASEKGGFVDSACLCSGTMKLHVLCLARLILNKIYYCQTCKEGFKPIINGQLSTITKKGTDRIDIIGRHETTHLLHGSNTTYLMKPDNEFLILQGSYENSKAHGLFRQWKITKKGKYYLHSEATYDKHVLHGLSTSLYPNGIINSSIIYVKGKKHGEHVRRYENNVIMQKCTYVHGQIHGPFESWYPNGNKDIVCSYLHGKLHGPYLKYNVSGLLKVQQMYTNGSMTSFSTHPITTESSDIIPPTTTVAERFNSTVPKSLTKHLRRNSI